MARTRSIKPAFFTNEHLSELPPETRLLFIALWTIADRDGRMEDRPKRIKAEVFPYDNYDLDVMLLQLHHKKFITRYSINGARYIQINNFARHQNPHPKEQSNGYPEPLEVAENIDAIYLHGNAEKLNDESSLLPITYYPLPSTLLPTTEDSEKPKTVFPDWLNVKTWNEYLEMRNKIKKPATDRAKELAINKLEKMRGLGYDPNLLLEQSILNCWQDIYEPKQKGNINGKSKVTSQMEDILQNGW